ncbi:hypothetical protein EG329_002645 [Mollisiaceae sp. DMI_Dod_QoI]|nr:hypothetical protein EG329_002645 [Helotiales sp. DMI_Dod_QoI]
MTILSITSLILLLSLSTLPSVLSHPMDPDADCCTTVFITAKEPPVSTTAWTPWLDVNTWAINPTPTEVLVPAIESSIYNGFVGVKDFSRITTSTVTIYGSS